VNGHKSPAVRVQKKKTNEINDTLQYNIMWLVTDI
jgi:hypothetical protein